MTDWLTAHGFVLDEHEMWARGAVRVYDYGRDEWAACHVSSHVTGCGRSPETAVSALCGMLAAVVVRMTRDAEAIEAERKQLQEEIER